MNITVMFVFLFGVFTLVGGIIGYTQAGSVASLLAGSVSGIILLIGAAGIVKGSQLGAAAALVVAILLGGRFAITLIKNFRIIPDLLMVLFSLGTIIVVLRFLLRK